MIDVPMLLADLDGFIKLAVLLIFIVGPLIGKLSGSKKPVRQPPPRPPVPPPVQAGLGGRPLPNAREELEAEVGKFLQDAGLRPRPQPVAQPVAQPALQPIPQLVPQPVEELITAEVIEADARQGDSVAEHVRGHIDSSALGDHAAHLGDGLRQADETMERHLHEVFDHSVGELPSGQQKIARIAEGTDAEFWSDKPGGAGARSESSHTAAQISKVIRNPERFKEAIILSEILTRPKF